MRNVWKLITMRYLNAKLPVNVNFMTNPLNGFNSNIHQTVEITCTPNSTFTLQNIVH